MPVYKLLVVVGHPMAENMANDVGHIEAPDRQAAAKKIDLVYDSVKGYACLPESDQVKIYFHESCEVISLEPLREAAKHIQGKKLRKREGCF